ncbi:hypothetical protein CYMTET_14079 [Cymbomonas tetramitiformis]|uniref:C-type lectin domain-containing protein n=1 Tax=Cymbomonas tetramitiformis TaxID=36881 RepID=A0AAE0LA91_9CHLO|nr:hypothetical protein CYMTET_14079 [Cymbomonas tetramitiformis]
MKALTFVSAFIPLLRAVAGLPCPDGWIHGGALASDSKCYFLNSGADDQLHTLSDCEELVCGPRGGALVCIESEDESRLLRGLLASYPNFVWLGFRRSAEEGNWKWSGSCNSTYAHWLQDAKLSDDCALMGSTLEGWVDASCSLPAQCLCELTLPGPPAPSLRGAFVPVISEVVQGLEGEAKARTDERRLAEGPSNTDGGGGSAICGTAAYNPQGDYYDGGDCNPCTCADVETNPMGTTCCGGGGDSGDSGCGSPWTVDGTEYTFGTEGAATCPDESSVMDFSECAALGAAYEALCPEVAGADFGREDWSGPRGCHIQGTSGGGNFQYNVNEEGGGADGHIPVCRVQDGGGGSAMCGTAAYNPQGAYYDGDGCNPCTCADMETNPMGTTCCGSGGDSGNSEPGSRDDASDNQHCGSVRYTCSRDGDGTVMRGVWPTHTCGDNATADWAPVTDAAPFGECMWDDLALEAYTLRCDGDVQEQRYSDFFCTQPTSSANWSACVILEDCSVSPSLYSLICM